MNWEMTEKTVRQNREFITMLSYSMRRAVELNARIEKAKIERQILRDLQRGQLNEHVLTPERLRQIADDIKTNHHRFELTITPGTFASRGSVSHRKVRRLSME